MESYPEKSGVMTEHDFAVCMFGYILGVASAAFYYNYQLWRERMKP